MRRLKRLINTTLSTVGYTLVRHDTQKIRTAPTRREPDGPILEWAHLTPVENQPPRSCTDRAPKFVNHSNRPLAKNILEFQENGITVIPVEAMIQASAWAAAEAFDNDAGNRHVAWDWAGNSRMPYSEDIRTGLPSDGVIHELVKMFSSEDFESFFTAVLGCPAMVANCRLVKSPPHSRDGVGPQSWHQDGCPPGVIRGVLYLTEVNEDSGPFQYKDASGGEHTVFGHAGDLLIFDAMRLRHRALPPKKVVRKAIDLVFMPRLPGEPFKLIVAGMNHWPADPFFHSIPVASYDHKGAKRA